MRTSTAIHLRLEVTTDRLYPQGRKERLLRFMNVLKNNAEVNFMNNAL